MLSSAIRALFWGAFSFDNVDAKKEAAIMTQAAPQANYYLVTTMCGHVGKKHYIPINFAIEAITPMEAMEKARRIPRVKHDSKYAILDIKLISYEAYLEQRKANREDSYLKARSDEDLKAIPGLKKRIHEYGEDKPSKTGQSKRRAYWQREGRYQENGRKGKFAW